MIDSSETPRTTRSVKFDLIISKFWMICRQTEALFETEVSKAKTSGRTKEEEEEEEEEQQLQPRETGGRRESLLLFIFLANFPGPRLLFL